QSAEKPPGFSGPAAGSSDRRINVRGSPTTENAAVNAQDFPQFIRRIRAGDQQAAAELVAHYEALIRCQVRLWLTDPRLCRLFDSLDICQSVLASFFLRAAAGQYDLDRPGQLIHLLTHMARNKVVSKARQLQARAADRQRIEEADLEAVVADTAGPGEQI